MQLDSAEDLVQALRASGLFTPEQLRCVARDLDAFDGDLQAAMRHLVQLDRITLYQLGKVVRGRAADLLVGPYVVLDKLGEGGMGKVFRARHVDRDRTVALKVIRPSLVANPVVRGRYAREVQATGKLHHPNIVRVDDAGEAGGKFYLAMEFVDGIDLARLMRDFRMVEVAEACEYARQAALGLQHAHDSGLVHRDIKPSNIVVAGERHLPQATEPAVVKVLDLGLARAMDPDDMVAPDLTRDHTVVGTPDYMAPEQAKNSKLVDGRSDLYSLGCTMYFLLTGQPPFAGGNAIQKMMQHQTDPPPPLQALRPDVPDAVAEIVARLMAKKPADRFASAAELAEALAPHARYPAGAAAVPVTPARARDELPPSDVVPPRSTLPPSTLGSSRTPGSPPGPSAPVPLPVAPSDATPRPRVLSEAKKRAASKWPQPHPVPDETEGAAPTLGVLQWVVIAAAVAVLAALAVWAALM